jgi:hypothetical protein
VGWAAAGQAYASDSTYHAYIGEIGAGSGNLNGTAYRDDISLQNNPLELPAVQQLFTAFPADPDEANTGNLGYNASAWNFHLNSPPAGVVNGGDATYLSGDYIKPMYRPAGGPSLVVGSPMIGTVTTDLEGNTRSGTPDMGAYEK